MRTRGAIAAAMLAAAGVCGPAAAGDLTYSPQNPGFGGNPNYFDYLISQAQIQNQFTDEGGGGGGNGGGGGAPPQISFPPINIDLGGATPGTPGDGQSMNPGDVPAMAQ